MTKTKKKLKPFLRWAGGKSWLVKHLDDLIGSLDFNNYHEPFLGGGSVFLAINPNAKSYLSDLNKDLIDTYNEIKNNPKLVIEELRRYKNNEKFYYKLRETNFTIPAKKAARFIYLNQTSFNGVYRVNLNGKYNVPYGFRTRSFLEEDKLLETSKRLRNCRLFHGDFDKARKNIIKA